MERRKWTLVLVIVCMCPYVYTRPSQDTVSPSVTPAGETTEQIAVNSSSVKHEVSTAASTPLSTTTILTNAPRDVKTKLPLIGESIKMVTSQLLQPPSNSSAESTIVADTRIPPKLKNQLAHKHKIRTRNEDKIEKTENSHAGIAVPVTLEELESENKVVDTPNESSTSNEGISTWILLSNPTNKDNNILSSTEATKPDISTKKPKPSTLKNKTKRPQQPNIKNSLGKRPIIGSTNKSDLIAGGSALNENVYNKIKDTVLSNVQKNKNRTSATTTVEPISSSITTVKETSTKPTSTALPIVKVTSKPSKKKNKNKHKTTTTLEPIISDSALLPMEPKEQEIELEISTPATTTKKPKRSSPKKKKKNKKKKTKPKVETAVSEIKTSNKTKAAKPSKKPINPISTQIYNYLSREVMPSVGVGIVGLASLVGLAGYFLYPFSSPVRRTFEVDKKDDIYRHNAEEYANDGNGQAEEEMLGTVLAGMPAHSKSKLNPYLGQTNQRYPQKKEKEQNIRYRQKSGTYVTPSYNVHYQQNYQQKTGIAHGAVYPDQVNYNTQYETRKNSFSYPAVKPVYAAPQTGPSSVITYDSEPANAVVYGVKPTQDTEFKPVYPYEGQVYSETTSQPVMTYPPTSMYLGSNNESEESSDDLKYEDNSGSEIDNKFVVGNVPKELSENVTPAIVPEHGPRKLNRKKRSSKLSKRSLVSSIDDLLNSVKKGHKDVFLSNEIDETIIASTASTSGMVITSPSTTTEKIVTKNKPFLSVVEESKLPNSENITVYPVYSIPIDANEKADNLTQNVIPLFKDAIIESVSTIPLQTQPTTDSELSNELETTTKQFKIYEVFNNNTTAAKNEAQVQEITGVVLETTTEAKQLNTETTTDTKLETTSIFPSLPADAQTKAPTESTFSSTSQPKPTLNPNIITYPPYNEEGSFLTFLKRLIEFKYKLGLSILQTTSENLNRYLRSLESSVNKMANGT